MVSCGVHRYVKKKTCGENCSYMNYFNESLQAAVAYIVISSVLQNRSDLAEGGRSSSEKETALMEEVSRASNANGVWYLYHKCEADFICNEIHIKKREQVKKLWGLLEIEIGKEKNLSVEDQRRAFERASSSEYMKEILGVRVGSVEEDTIAAYSLMDLCTDEILAPIKKRKTVTQLPATPDFKDLQKFVNGIEMSVDSVNAPDRGISWGEVLQQLGEAERQITCCVSEICPEVSEELFKLTRKVLNLSLKVSTLMHGLVDPNLASSSAPKPSESKNSSDYYK